MVKNKKFEEELEEKRAALEQLRQIRQQKQELEKLEDKGTASLISSVRSLQNIESHPLNYQDRMKLLDHIGGIKNCERLFHLFIEEASIELSNKEKRLTDQLNRLS